MCILEKYLVKIINKYLPYDYSEILLSYPSLDIILNSRTIDGSIDYYSLLCR